jgi:hypothetical protein
MAIMTNNKKQLYTPGLSPKQKLQIEIINADAYLEHFTTHYPQSRPVVDHLRDALGQIMHLSEGVDVTEFCQSQFVEGGLN